MTDSKPTRLSEVIPPYAPQGTTDRQWAQMEHHLIQAKFSLSSARICASVICMFRENAEDLELAEGCFEIITEAYTRFLLAHAALLSLLSDSNVSERVGNIEL